jgi:sugar lactone lactonase YvrE
LFLSPFPDYIKVDPNTKWAENSTIHAGKGASGQFLSQLHYPEGICIAEFGVLYIADSHNNRVVEWLQNSKEGREVAGGHISTDPTQELNYPTSVIHDEGSRSLIICDSGNRRVVQVSLINVGRITSVLIENIHCMGLAMDNEAFLYVSDARNFEVRRYRLGDPKGTLVAMAEESN